MHAMVGPIFNDLSWYQRVNDEFINGLTYFNSSNLFKTLVSKQILYFSVFGFGWRLRV